MNEFQLRDVVNKGSYARLQRTLVITICDKLTDDCIKSLHSSSVRACVRVCVDM